MISYVLRYDVYQVLICVAIIKYNHVQPTSESWI